MALTKVQAAGLTADLIDETKLADNSIDSEHYNDGSIDNAHLADDAVGIAELSATGTASSSTFLRGDNSWVTPTDTNTTYSVGDGGLTTNDFTNADHTKLDGIAASANNYVHPNHSGEVTSTADGATVIADDIVDEANLKVSNAPTNGYFLSAQSGNTGGLTWAEAGGGVSSDAQYNTLAGTNAGEDIISGGTNNTLIGYNAGKEITDKDQNTYVGYRAGENSTTGESNTYIGSEAGVNATTALSCTIVGQQAGQQLTTGNNNVLIGQANGDALTTGYENVSIGTAAFSATGTNPYHNVAIGQGALTNTTTHSNIAIGRAALETATSANKNTVIGKDAGHLITTGSDNTLLGQRAGEEMTTAFNNLLVGTQAGRNLTTGHSNVIIGHYSSGDTLTTGNTNAIIHGNVSAAASEYEFVIGPIAGRGNGTFVAGGTNGVYNQANNSSWSTTSDRRIKKNIVDNNDGLSKINSIRVRNFEYRDRDELDYTEFTEGINPDSIGIPDKKGTQLGVIAQEIQEVLPEVVTQSTTGQYTVNPDNITWHLVNAVKELSAKVTELEAKLNG